VVPLRLLVERLTDSKSRKLGGPVSPVVVPGNSGGQYALKVPILVIDRAKLESTKRAFSYKAADIFNNCLLI